MSELDDWVYQVVHEVKVLITTKAVEDQPEIMLHAVYKAVADALQQDGERLETTVERAFHGLAN